MKIFGKKISMTHVEERYSVSPVTVLDVSENVVATVAPGKIHLGWGKLKNPTKAQLGKFKELGYTPYKTMEVPLEGEQKVGTYEVKDLPELVHITGTSKGKGYAGVVKRYKFKGKHATHGTSDKERGPGSIGAGTTPGRVFKGKKMGGRMGSDTVKIRNVKVMKLLNDGNKTYLVVKGSVPGPSGSIIQISW